MRSIREIYYWKYTPYVLLGILMLILHLFINTNSGDDVFFGKVLNNDNLFIWLGSRYMNWSSRLIIEGSMVILLSLPPLIWEIIDILMFLLLAYSLSALFGDDNRLINNVISVLLVIFYPIMELSSAGWAATTMNYLWPLALGLYAMIPIKKIIHSDIIKKYEYVLYTSAILYASNQEQMCVILLCVYSFSMIYIFINNKAKIYIGSQLIVLCSSIAFILSCPGNNVRKLQEIENWMPDYNMLTFFDKIQLGLSSTLSHIFFSANLVMLVLCLLIAIAIFNKYKQKIYRVIGLIPLIGTLFGTMVYIASLISSRVYNLIIGSVNPYGYISIGNISIVNSYLPFIILGVILIFVIVSLYIIFGNSYLSVISIGSLLLGLVSRLIMGFSPTLWASSDRTYIFFCFSIAINIFLVYKQLGNTKNRMAQTVLYVLSIVGIYLFINHFVALIAMAYHA